MNVRPITTSTRLNILLRGRPIVIGNGHLFISGNLLFGVLGSNFEGGINLSNDSFIMLSLCNSTLNITRAIDGSNFSNLSNLFNRLGLIEENIGKADRSGISDFSNSNFVSLSLHISSGSVCSQCGHTSESSHYICSIFIEISNNTLPFISHSFNDSDR